MRVSTIGQTRWSVQLWLATIRTVRKSWGRHDRADEAVELILDAAEELHLSQGFDATTMASVATRAGCSRATLYNYFPTKQALRTTLRNKAVVEIAGDVLSETVGIADPVERVTEALITTIHRVRAIPSQAVWFASDNIAPTLELARSTDVIEMIAAAFVTSSQPGNEELARVRARLTLRLVVSLLSAPEATEADERALLETLVAPMFANSTAGQQRHSP